jgi:hypothetical protein
MVKNLSAAIVALSLVAVAQPASAQFTAKTFNAQMTAQMKARLAQIQAEAAAMKVQQAKMLAEMQAAQAKMQAELQAAEKAAGGL